MKNEEEVREKLEEKEEELESNPYDQSLLGKTAILSWILEKED